VRLLLLPLASFQCGAGAGIFAAGIPDGLAILAGAVFVVLGAFRLLGCELRGGVFCGS